MAFTDAADDQSDTNPDIEPASVTGAKASQEESNYRRGTPMKNCGICVYYEGDADKACSKVEGPISGFGVSDVFAMQTNPFGSTIGPREAAMIDGMMGSPPDQSPAVAAAPDTGRVQIGNRSYAP